MYIRDTLKQVQGDRGWLSQRYSSQEPVLAQPEPIKCIIPQKTLYYPILPSSERATYHSEAATPLALIEAATPLAPKLQNRIAANLQTSKPPNPQTCTQPPTIPHPDQLQTPLASLLAKVVNAPYDTPFVHPIQVAIDQGLEVLNSI